MRWTWLTLIGLVLVGLLFFLWRATDDSPIRGEGPREGSPGTASGIKGITGIGGGKTPPREFAATAGTRAKIPLETGVHVTLTGDEVRVAGVRVTAWKYVDDYKWQRGATGTTDAGGEVTLPVEAGEHCLWPHGAGVPLDLNGGAFDIETGEVRRVALRVPAPCTIRGRLLDSEKRPVAGAKVQVRTPYNDWPAVSEFFKDNPLQAATDAHGRFTLSGLTPATREFWTDVDGHARFEKSITLAEGSTSDLGDLVLSKGSPAFGRVQTSTGEPIVGAKVTSRSSSYVAVTGADGRFEIPALGTRVVLDIECKTYIAEAVVLGRARRNGDVRFGKVHPRDEPVMVTMERSRRIEGKVENYRGKVQISYRREVGNQSWSTETVADEHGRFEFEDVATGTVELQAWDPGRGYSDVVKFPVEKLVHRPVLRIDADRALRVEVKVVDGRGAPVANAEVKMEASDEGDGFQILFVGYETAQKARTDAAGVAKFGGLVACEHELVVEAEGFVDGWEQFEVRADTPKRVVKLRSAGRLVVRVGGAAAARNDAEVRYETSDEDKVDLEPLSARVAARGRWLPAGEYTVSAMLARSDIPSLAYGLDARASRVVKLVAGKTTEVELVPQPPTLVSGRVVRNGKGVPDLRMSVNPGKHGRSWQSVNLRTDREGRFQIQFLTCNDWVFEAHIPTSSYSYEIGRIKIVELGAKIEREWNLPASLVQGSLSASLRDKAGKWPVVLVVPDSMADQNPVYRPFGKSITDDHAHPVARDGSFSIGPLQDGSWLLRVIRDGLVVVSTPIVIRSAPVALGQLASPAGGKLTVQLRYAGQQTDPIGGVLRVPGKKPGKGVFVRWVKAKDDLLEFGEVPFGRYTLEFGKPLHEEQWYFRGASVEIEHQSETPRDAPLEVTVPKVKRP